MIYAVSIREGVRGPVGRVLADSESLILMVVTMEDESEAVR